MSTITTDWDAIQSRAIDPFANVDSDVANLSHICMGSSKMFYTGFELESFEIDNVNNLLLANFSNGSIVMDNVSIKINESFTIPVISFPNVVSILKAIVVQYHYEKTKPAPVASIKVINDSEIDTNTQFKLYTFKTGAWTSIIDLETWNAWKSQSGNWNDLRYLTGPLFRNGDTTAGCINCISLPTTDTHLTNKKYVDKLVSEVVDPSLVLKTNGGTITGPICWATERTPTISTELVTKGYTDSQYLSSTGGTVTGIMTFQNLVNVPYPTTSSNAVNVDYVNNILGTLDEGVLATYLRKLGGDMFGPINMPFNAITSDTHLINRQYGDTRYLLKSGGLVSGTLRCNIDNIVTDDSFITKEFANEQFLKKTSIADDGTVASKEFVADTYVSKADVEANRVISKEYADATYVAISSLSERGFATTQYVDDKFATKSEIANSGYISASFANQTYVPKTDSTYWNNSRNVLTGTTNGTLELQNGFKMKWGRVELSANDSGSWINVTFPQSFSSDCYNVTTTTVSTIYDSTDQIMGTNMVKNISNTGFQLYSSYYSTNGCIIMYQAIGR